ncbi:MAG: alpha/beta fold hydrolase [Bacteroidetes bacterium]|nr:alpha/beta fold hydrolase [Bacteroidota bacterium]
MKKTVLIKLMTILSVVSLAGCNQRNNFPIKSKTFVLVHGAWQAPYVWNTVRTELENAGQHVVLVELPAHGDDTTSPALVSIDVYRDKVIDAINKINGKVVLVGHSMGGVVVSEVAEAIPGKIEKLIFIGAFVPANGQSLLQLAGADQQSLLGPALVPSKDQLLLDVMKDSIINIFCQDGSSATQQLLLDNYRAEPAIPFTNPAVLTSGNFGSVNKYYIFTLLDHAIGINNQHAMAQAANIMQTYSVNTGHSPFLSKPDDVTKLLLQITQ